MKLNLTKPLAFIDLETTGINVGIDRIIEISVLRMNVDGSKDIKTKYINPQQHIPEFTTKIHGITDEMVKDAPTFKDAAGELNNFLKDCDLAGFNSNKFDIPMLVEEFLRAEVDFDMKGRRMVDVQVIFHKKEPRNLGAAYQFFCNKKIENAHSAEADIVATAEVLEAQLDRYPDLENDINFLSNFSTQQKTVDFAGRIVYNEAGQEVFSFGKHKDKTVESVFQSEPSYYKWMMDGDFPLYTKKVITQIRLRAAALKK